MDDGFSSAAGTYVATANKPLQSVVHATSKYSETITKTAHNCRQALTLEATVKERSLLSPTAGVEARWWLRGGLPGFPWSWPDQRRARQPGSRCRLGAGGDERCFLSPSCSLSRPTSCVPTPRRLTLPSRARHDPPPAFASTDLTWPVNLPTWRGGAVGAGSTGIYASIYQSYRRSRPRRVVRLQGHLAARVPRGRKVGSRSGQDRSLGRHVDMKT